MRLNYELRAILVISLMLAQRAAAQQYLAPLLSDGNPVATAEDADVMKRIFALDEEQQDAARMLLESYSGSLAAQMRIAQRRDETVHMEARGWHDPRLYEKQRKLAADNKLVAIRLEKDLINDLRDLLTSEQRTSWERFDESRRMRYMLPHIQRPLANAMLSDSVRDLIRKDREKKAAAALRARQRAEQLAEVERVQNEQNTGAATDDSPGGENARVLPSPKTATPTQHNESSVTPTSAQQEAAPADDVSSEVLDGPLLDLATQYESELGGALGARGNVGLYYNSWDYEERHRPRSEQAKRFEAVRDADKRLFDLQSKYVEAFSLALPDDLREKWRASVRKLHFGFAYHASKRRARMKQIARLEGITPDQHVTVMSQIEQVDLRVRILQDEFFNDWKYREFRRTFEEEDSGENYPDHEGFREKRRAVEEPVLTRLLAMLTPAQRRGYEDGVFREKKNAPPGGAFGDDRNGAGSTDPGGEPSEPEEDEDDEGGD
jgi:hypothetical protein